MHAVISTLYDEHFVAIFNSEESAVRWAASFARQRVELNGSQAPDLQDDDLLEFFREGLESMEWFTIEPVRDERQKDASGRLVCPWRLLAELMVEFKETSKRHQGDTCLAFETTSERIAECLQDVHHGSFERIPAGAIVENEA